MNSQLNYYNRPKAIALNNLLSLERVGERDLRIIFSVNWQEKLGIEPRLEAASLENNECVSLLAKNKLMLDAKKLIEQSEFSWLKETVLAYETLLIMFDDRHSDYYAIRCAVVELFEKHSSLFSIPKVGTKLSENEHSLSPQSSANATHVIPVCYSLEGEEYPHDRDKIAQHTGMSAAALIDVHTAGNYQVFAVGFMPNFAYLGELDKKIHTPRLAEPRRKVPAGAVAIADGQTAIYPSASPGGWHIIGYTPLDLSQHSGIHFNAGEKVEFRAVSEASFQQKRLAIQRDKYA